MIYHLPTSIGQFLYSSLLNAVSSVKLNFCLHAISSSFHDVMTTDLRHIVSFKRKLQCHANEVRLKPEESYQKRCDWNTCLFYDASCTSVVEGPCFIATKAHYMEEEATMTLKRSDIESQSHWVRCTNEAGEYEVPCNHQGDWKTWNSHLCHLWSNRCLTHLRSEACGNWNST